MSLVKHVYQGQGIHFLHQLARTETPEFLLRLYRGMLRIRKIEQAIAGRYSEDQMKTPVHLAIGQEAVPVGVMGHFSHKDYAFCGHRTHSVYLAKGGDLKAMFSEFHCRANGCCASRGGSMHLIDKSVGMMGSSAIVAGIIPIATGAAFAVQQKKEDRVVVVFLGDAAAEEGACWESLNFAVLKKLPVLYVCENNFYSVCSPIEYRQPVGVSISGKAKAFGLYTDTLDGNNVLEVHKATEKALQYITSGKGPAFLEAFTYRWLGHQGSDEDFGYRTLEELLEWKAYDPLLMMAQVLQSEGLLTTNRVTMMEQEIHTEIEAAFAHALASPEPEMSDLKTHVYA